MITYITSKKNHILTSFFISYPAKIFVRFTHTTTITTTVSEEKTNTNNNNATIQNSTINEPKLVTNVNDDSSAELLEKLKKENEALEALIHRQMPSTKPRSTPYDDIPVNSNQSPSFSTSTDTSSIENKINSMDNNIPITSLPNIDIAAALLPIKTTCKITGEALTNRLTQMDVLLTENENALKRQEALYDRISAFFTAFGLGKRVKQIGLGIAVGYTIWNIIRYRQIPFGGFLKGLFIPGTGGGLGTGGGTSNVANNFTFELPKDILPHAKEAVSNSASDIVNALNHLDNRVWGVLLFVLWVVKKGK